MLIHITAIILLRLKLDESCVNFGGLSPCKSLFLKLVPTFFHMLVLQICYLMAMNLPISSCMWMYHYRICLPKQYINLILV